MGSGSNSHEDLSYPIGHWIAKKGLYLVNGGGGGVMESVAKAFSETPKRTGLTLGIIPSNISYNSKSFRYKWKSPLGYPNQYIDLPIQTHLHLSGARGKEITSRNHIVVLTASIVIALPGGTGTRTEIQLALDYGKPLIILSPHGEWKEFEKTRATLTRLVENTIKEIEKLIIKIKKFGFI